MNQDRAIVLRDRMRELSRNPVILSVTILLAFSLDGCGPREPVSPPGGLGGSRTGESRCNYSGDTVSSLVVDWSLGQRAHLAAVMASRPVIVSVTGCEMEILSDCVSTGGAYSYQPIPPKSQHERYTDESELHAAMPFSAAKLSGHLTRSSFLQLDMTMVGQYSVDRAAADSNLLTGRCVRATHMITSINVGAFDLRSADSSSRGAGVSVAGAELGGSRSRSIAWSTRDGDAAECGTQASDSASLQSCRSPISIRLAPLKERHSGSGDLRRNATKSWIATGAHHACALNSAGALKCWGHNTYGQLGNGTTSASLVPTGVTGLSSGVSAVAAGGAHTCALAKNGSVVCWGDNESGQLGNGSRQKRHVPTVATGLESGAVAVSTGGSHTCALAGHGSVMCWGDNRWGQLGNGSKEGSLVPLVVIGMETGMVAVSAGYKHTCAVSGVGAVMCWGDNREGQIGSGAGYDDERLAPVGVPGLRTGVSSVASGGSLTCALKTDGTVSCWGDALSGVMDAATQSPGKPFKILRLDAAVSSIAVGRTHACALKPTSTVACWGVYDGATFFLNEAKPIDDLNLSVSAIAVGDSYACAVDSSGAAACWGKNESGQLGNGKTGNSMVPVRVEGLR